MVHSYMYGLSCDRVSGEEEVPVALEHRSSHERGHVDHPDEFNYTGSRLVRDDLSVKLPAQSRSGGVRLMCSERMNVRGQSANGFQYNGEVGRTNGLWTAWHWTKI